MPSSAPVSLILTFFQHDHSILAYIGDDDATDAQCTIASVPNVMEGNILDHLGPYEGIYIGDIYCT
jgi:hypothetical protein